MLDRLSVAILTVIVGLILTSIALGLPEGPIQIGPGPVVLGFAFQLIGVTFVWAYSDPDRCALFRAMIWLCENFSSPPGRFMAWFYFGLFFLIGTAVMLQGMFGTPPSKP